MVYDGAWTLDRCTHYRHDHRLHLKESRRETYIEPSRVSQANPHPYSLLHDVDLLLDAGCAPDQKLYPHWLRFNNLHSLIYRNHGRFPVDLLGNIPILAPKKSKNLILNGI